MDTKLIELEDGTLVEVKVKPGQAQPIAGGFAYKVSTTFDQIHPLLAKICRPIADAWKELNQEIHIEQAEIELGLSFEGEGNLFITKSKARANLTIKLILKHKE